MIAEARPPLPLSIRQTATRLLAAVGTVVLANQFTFEQWPVLGLMIVGGLALLGAWGVPWSRIWRRLLLFWPMVIACGLSVPLTQPAGSPHGWEWAATLFLRSTAAFLSGLWLVHAVPFAAFLTLLRWCRCPAVLVYSLALATRYAEILWSEWRRMQRAAQCRQFRGRTTVARWREQITHLGQLILRAFDRAEQTHRAMLARGGDAFGGKSDGR